jgi:hypothetical protein
MIETEAALRILSRFEVSMIRRWMLPFSLLLMLSAFLQAQSRGMSGAVHPGFGQPIGTPTRRGHSRFSQSRSPRPYRNNALIFGDPYLYDYADYSAEAPAPSAPQVVVTHEAQPVSAPEPLMLEWQNDRWVRVGSTGDPAQSNSTGDLRASVHPAAEAPPPPPAVLVFTDGHTEEVNRYMIVGKIMYANSDYWKTGSWTKKILLSSIDLPASLRANQERGAKLVLPGGPNEVVIGP